MIYRRAFIYSPLVTVVYDMGLYYRETILPKYDFGTAAVDIKINR